MLNLHKRGFLVVAIARNLPQNVGCMSVRLPGKSLGKWGNARTNGGKMVEQSRFIEGRWCEAKSPGNTFHVLKICSRVKCEGVEPLPFNPIITLDGMPIKALQECVISSSHSDWIRVTLHLVCNIDGEIPCCELTDETRNRFEP